MHGNPGSANANQLEAFVTDETDNNSGFSDSMDF